MFKFFPIVKSHRNKNGERSRNLGRDLSPLGGVPYFKRRRRRRQSGRRGSVDGAQERGRRPWRLTASRDVEYTWTGDANSGGEGLGRKSIGAVKWNNSTPLFPSRLFYRCSFCYCCHSPIAITERALSYSLFLSLSLSLSLSLFLYCSGV